MRQKLGDTRAMRPSSAVASRPSCIASISAALVEARRAVVATGSAHSSSPETDRGRHGRRPVGDPELLVDVLEVRLHGGRAQVQPGADLGRREPVGGQRQHLALALRDRGPRAPPRSRTPCASAVCASGASTARPAAMASTAAQMSLRSESFSR